MEFVDHVVVDAILALAALGLVLPVGQDHAEPEVVTGLVVELVETTLLRIFLFL